MKNASFGFFVGIMIMLSSAAHAFLGWPQFSQVLTDAALDDQTTGALRIGWFFGSACMLAFSVIVIQQAIRQFRGLRIQSGPLWAISLMYFLFGTIAFVLREFNPHFLLFVFTGVLVAMFAFPGSSLKSFAATPDNKR